MKKIKLIKKKIDNFDMYLDASGKGISATLNSYGYREPDFMWIMKTEAKGKLALDIGGNIGYTSLNLSNNVTNVISIEPDPRTRYILKKNVELNNLQDRIKICNFAVSDCNGESTIHLADSPNLSTLCNPIKKDKEKNKYKKIKIRTKTIDSLNIQPSFIKMDIEGYEVEALLGAMNTLKNAYQCGILIEVHPQYYTKKRNFELVLRELVLMGYKFKYVLSAGMSQPEAFRLKGYVPFSIFSSPRWQGNYLERGLYNSISIEDAIYFCSNLHREYSSVLKKYTDKIVRAILLERNSEEK